MGWLVGPRGQCSQCNNSQYCLWVCGKVFPLCGFIFFMIVGCRNSTLDIVIFNEVNVWDVKVISVSCTYAADI
jgi:hypothetical protein